MTLISAHEVHNQSLADYQQLEYAISEHWAIFTFNVGDFNRLHEEYMKNGKDHFGIILSKQIPLSDAIKRLTKFLFSHSQKQVRNNIFWI